VRSRRSDTAPAVLAAPAEVALFIRDVQRGTVQVGAEPADVALAVIPEMVDTRQRAVGFVRIINIGPAAIFLLLLQQAITLPQEGL